MRRVRILKTVLAVGFAVLALSAYATRQSGAKLYGNANRGQQIFTMWCASCHQDTPHAADEIPTFSQLVGRKGLNDAALRVFLAQPHKPMPPLELSNQQIEDIVAYFRGARAEKAPPSP